MARPSPPGRNASGSTDPDGIVRIKTAPGGRSPLLWLAMGAVVALAAAAVWLWRGAPAISPAAPSKATTAGPAPARSGAGRPPGARAAAPEQPALTAAPHAADTADDDDSDALPPAGAEPGRDGIYAFPAPGTKRIKVGVVVPEGFELPPGYVRHYQATDRGEMLPAILMYNPREPPLDAQGRPVEIPEDGVVPADRAPPGLPIELLRVPENAYATPHDPGALPGSEAADDSAP